MGRRGPPPKPSALKKAQGTYRPDRAAVREVEPVPGVPEMPRWLDAEGRREWKRVVPQLAGLGILATVDRAMLADYCAAHSLAVRATREYQRAPLMTEGPHGPVPNPLLKVAKEARAQARLLGAEFGLSAASRSRISAPEAKPDGDQSEDFLFGEASAARPAVPRDEPN
jgi:P27 family predicted phage terminase small subunit